MKRRTWQHITGKGGWLFMATVGQMWGIGLTWFGRFNGMDIFFGPLTITIQPPAPEWAKGEVDWTKEDPGTCATCAQPWELVRPGKSQPTCDC